MFEAKVLGVNTNILHRLESGTEESQARLLGYWLTFPDRMDGTNRGSKGVAESCLCFNSTFPVGEANCSGLRESFQRFRQCVHTSRAWTDISSSAVVRVHPPCFLSAVKWEAVVQIGDSSNRYHRQQYVRSM